MTVPATGRVQDAPSTPVGQFRAWVDAFERLGYDADRLLAEIGVARSDFPDPDRLIPCAVVGALFQRAQQIRPLKNPWARLGAVTPLGALPLLDYLILTSDTVGNGVEQASRYFRLVGAPFELDIRSEEDPVRVVYQITGPAPPSTVEYSAILCLQAFRSETDGRMRFAYVSLTYEPDDVSEIEELLDCEVRAKASWSGWAVAHDIWDLPLRRRDPVLRSLLERQADAMVTRTPVAKGLAGDIRRVLASRLARGEADIGLVARDLAMSSRTLQRRLAAEGLSYHELLDRVRRETAETCLGDSSLAIAEVAYLTGYSEPAAFHRAFRRWTGVTPQAFRQRSRGSPACRRGAGWVKLWQGLVVSCRRVLVRAVKHDGQSARRRGAGATALPSGRCFATSCGSQEASGEAVASALLAARDPTVQ